MCGIAGFVGNLQKDVRHLERMLDTIVHRGPNSAGTFTDEIAAIGMRRLSIIDLAGGDQPIANSDETIWTVSNGEIYNYQSVRAELKGLGYQFKTNSDTEVIVHAYEHWGDDFVDHLEGMFGTAIWDTRRSRLVLIRDRLGIKPLYIAEKNGVLAFGSEMKCIFAGGFASPEVDPEALQDYLAFGYAIAPRTIAKGVEKLAPGQMLTWEKGKTTRRTYWRLPADTSATSSLADWSEATRAELTTAVQSHLISDVPLGSFLSGGIDSSGIVGLMEGVSNEPVNTYAIGYKGSDVAAYYNELPFAAEVARDYGTNHREIEVQPNVAELLPKLMWYLEEPISDTATMTTYLVSKMASETVTVIMSGVGGDELFAGYRRYLGDHYRQQYMRVPRWLRANLVEPMVGLLPSGRGSRLQDLGRYAKEFVRSADMQWSEQYMGYLTIGDPTRLQTLADSQLGAAQRFLGVCDDAGGDDPLQQLMYVDSQTQLPEALLLLSDKMTMACSLECRVPFLHHPFAEFASRIPADVKAPGGNLKQLLKNSLTDVLPDSVLNRRKRGFGAPVGTWLMEELAPLSASLLSQDALGRRNLVDPKAVTDVLNAHRSNQQDYTDLIMVLMNLELWCRIFQDGKSSEEITDDLSRAAA